MRNVLVASLLAGLVVGPLSCPASAAERRLLSSPDSTRGGGVCGTLYYSEAEFDTADAATGMVYLYGNEIRPPFLLTRSPGQLSLNGVPLLPPLVPPAIPQPESLDSYRLLDECMPALEEGLLFHTSLSAHERSDSVAHYVSHATALIDSVKPSGEYAFEFWRRGERHGETMLIGAAAMAGSTRDERILNWFGIWCRMLRHDQVVVFSGTRVITARDVAGRQNLHQEIAAARAGRLAAPTVLLPADVQALEEPLSIQRYLRGAR